MTGRGAGWCAGYAAPGYAGFRPAWTCWGGGGGWRNRFYATGLTGWQRAGAGWWGPAAAPFNAVVGEELELTTLRAQAENLTSTLEGIRKRIEALEIQGRKQAE